MNRIDNYERMYLGENLEMPEAASRIDALWKAILNKDELPFEPVTRVEKYLAKMIDSTIETPSPTTRLEEILCAICRGEKVDEATKNACKDEYLKYIYEQASGENMFVPNNPSGVDGVSYSGRTIVLNGTIPAKQWVAQQYKSTLLTEGETVTVRYKYKSGTMLGESNFIFGPSYKNKDEGYAIRWSTSTPVTVNASNYMTEQVIVTTLSNATTLFLISVRDGSICDNLTFEVSFEKGDTTK